MIHKGELEEEIEENFYIEGKDIGRTKNTELIRKEALEEELYRSSSAKIGIPLDEIELDESRDNRLKVRLAEVAVQEGFVHSGMRRDIAAEGALGVKTEYPGWSLYALRSRAAQVGADYDKLQAEARAQAISIQRPPRHQ